MFEDQLTIENLNNIPAMLLCHIWMRKIDIVRNSNIDNIWIKGTMTFSTHKIALGYGLFLLVAGSDNILLKNFCDDEEVSNSIAFLAD